MIRALEISHIDEASEAPYYLEENFCETADCLRSEYEKQVHSSIEANDGLTPLFYAHIPESCQFLVAGPERLFSQDALGKFMAATRQWAYSTVGAMHVSTPHVHVYVPGCHRKLLCDNVQAQWHYIFCLSPQFSRKSSVLRIVADGLTARMKLETLSLSRVISLNLEFNQLLVHKVTAPYGIEVSSKSADPLHGAVFFSGYLF